MAKHFTEIQEDTLQNYDVICLNPDCGWQDTAGTFESALLAAEGHAEEYYYE